MTAAQWFQKMREILATPGQSPEAVAFQFWWERQQRHQQPHRLRRIDAWYFMAGIPSHHSTRVKWGDLRATHRAAIIAAAHDTRCSLAGIGSVLEIAGPKAVEYLHKAAA